MSNSQSDTIDLFIIGGGINGVGIARDAVGRGLTVALCDKDDLGAATSSRSGKLIHGGLRYLEYYAFGLVRKALIEREVLLEAAPHIVWPIRFVLPHSALDRPAWLIRLGLFLYDHLGGRKRLASTQKLDLTKALEGAPLKDSYKIAFAYSDCWVDDSRLVILNALDAFERGAMIYPRTACTSAKRHKGLWHIEISQGDSVKTIRARALVNAAGPWVNDVIGQVVRLNSKRAIRLVKGSHIILQKFWEGDHGYLIQNKDKRVIFVNPYLDDLALIGTTDIPYQDIPEDVAIDEQETDYLLDLLNRTFTRTFTKKDILSTYAGVRPLYDDGNKKNASAVTRDYILDMDVQGNSAPLLSVLGGKITTFRVLAQDVLSQLTPFFPQMKKPWTHKEPLPGGDIKNADFDQFCVQLQKSFHFLSPSLVNHYARLYGTKAYRVLDGIRMESHLGRYFGGHLYEREALYLIAIEWAMTPQDILERRTKHGLRLSPQERKDFEDWFATQRIKRP